MSDTQPTDLSTAVAIVGMSCRLPGAANVTAFWRNLREGVESITFFSDEELTEAGVSPELIADPAYVKAGTVLDDVESFASDFFGIGAREAEVTDPQHRVFLECAWEAMEDAGYVPEAVSGRVSVYAGAGLNTYMIERLLPSAGLAGTLGALQLVIGNRADFLPSMVSYKLGLTGESVNVSTACSTSLVAVHMACRSLLSYESDMALAGGVSIAASQRSGYLYQPGGVFSPDGHCRPFDARAQGTVPGNGIGAVVLKRLDDALADGDNVIAVIRASAVNNDGAAKVGFTAPGVSGQREVVASALALAEVPAQTIGYVEAHGTGTAMGDPIEIRALTEAFHEGAQDKGFCAIGSVKSNFGHLDAAAGVVGLIKAALCLRHRTLVPTLHYETAPEAINFTATPFYVNTALAPWKSSAQDVPRRAGVSSFGIGGTNAHAILEEAPPTVASAPARKWQLLTVSAQSASALNQAKLNLAGHLRASPDESLADAAYTLHVGRKPFKWREATLAADGPSASSLLCEPDPQRSVTGCLPEKLRTLVFMFPGIGDHYPGMGWGLYQEEAVFRRHIDQCAESLLPRLGCDIRELLFPADVRDPASGAAESVPRGLPGFAPRTGERNVPLNRTEYLHPALFALEYALAQLWMDWLGEPSGLIGYSLGEYTAACVAGVMSLDDALMLVCKRAQLIQTLPPGRMVAVALPESELVPRLSTDLSVAAVNGSAMTVVSGPADAVAFLEQRLREEGVAHLPVQSGHAFHSTMMAPIEEDLRDAFAAADLKAPAIPYISNRSGTWIRPDEAIDPAHWASHTRDTVRFAEGLTTLLADPASSLLEVGPGQSLCSLLHQQAPRERAIPLVALPSLPSAHEAGEDTLFVARSLAALWCQGHAVDWARYHDGETRRRVSLPTYPFERQRHWIDPPGSRDRRHVPAQGPSPAPEMSLAPSTSLATFGSRPPYAPPETDFEAAVTQMWQELFRADQIGIDDNFFALGGSSLLAVQFLTRLRTAYQIELPLRAVFQAPTVRNVAAEVEKALLAELEGITEDEALSQVAEGDAAKPATAHGQPAPVHAKPYVLPNGLVVHHFNQVETDHFYHDIFDQKVYHRHGIQLPDDAVVFDVGANIGLFSLYACREAQGATLYAFEPAPPVFGLLRENLRANGVDAHVFNCGVADQSGSRKLTYYPFSTGMSSFHANQVEEKEVLHAIMENQLESGVPGMHEVMDYAEEILEERFRAQDFDCPMTTVSDVMREHALKKIDLMKIDVQKSELEVLQGIDEEHWPGIRQIVIEVHDLEGRVDRVTDMLRSRGYAVTVEQELLYRSSNISNLYALRQ